MQRKIPNINFRDKLHSIPISKVKNVKPNVLCSIPCGCVVALLLLGLVSIVPDIFSPTSSAYATEDYNEEDYGISPLAATAGLSIGTTGKITGNTTPGNVAYASNTITATASDVSSYTLSITGPVNLTGITSISGADSKTPANMADNTWGYAYNDSNSNENKTYKSFTGSAQTLESGTTPSGVAKDITFAAKFGENAASGHYMADIKLSLVATPATTTYTITYNANGGSGAPTSITCVAQGVSGTSCTTTLSSTKPTRTNYTFLGWSTSSNATTASYQAEGSITVSGNTTLYAVWQSQGAVWSDGTASGITYMQDITTGTSTSSFCSSSLPTHASITLKDKRDENSYTIVKMADGKCWMTQNLRIMGSRTLTSSDSDVTSSYALPASSTAGFNSNTTSNAYLSGSTGYYTWCAATAGTCTSADTNVSSSICPKGWKLPSGGSSGEFNAFVSAEGIENSSTGSTKIRGTPYNFAYTGYVLNGTFYGPASKEYGYWWSRTASGANTAYRLYIDSSSVRPGTINPNLCDGLAVRCITQ